MKVTQVLVDYCVLALLCFVLFSDEWREGCSAVNERGVEFIICSACMKFPQINVRVLVYGDHHKVLDNITN